MPILDFNEIPQASSSEGDQDKFELFTRDVLSSIGYKIQSSPGRGPDGGRDIIVVEEREGISGVSRIRWLVSCKHYSHSGDSVGTSDETNIRDRVESNNCDAFLGFYSTLPSSSLITRFESLADQIEVQWMDCEKIESILLSTAKGHDIAARFFPISFELWKKENPSPVDLFSDSDGLQCEHCGKELLTNEHISGIIVSWMDQEDGLPKRTYDIYWSCKGTCDLALKPKYDIPGSIDKWEDIPEVVIPQIYMKWIMSIINKLHDPEKGFSDKALEKLKTFLLELFPYVSRDLTSEEREKIIKLSGIPMGFGGLG